MPNGGQSGTPFLSGMILQAGTPGVAQAGNTNITGTAIVGLLQSLGAIIAGGDSILSGDLELRSAPNDKRLMFETAAGVLRASLALEGAEGGGDTGSNAVLRVYNDAGVLIDAPLLIPRQAGLPVYLLRDLEMALQNINVATVNGGVPISAGALSAANGSTLVGHQSLGTGAAVRTVQAKLRERISPEDRGAAGDGVTDDHTPLVNVLESSFHVEFGPHVYLDNTGNLDPSAFSTLSGVNREATYIRCGHAANPVFLSDSQFVRYEGMTIDRSGAAAGYGIRHSGVDNAHPLEGFKVYQCNVSGHGTGIYTRDTVFWEVSNSYVQSCGVGIDIGITGVNASTMIRVEKSWIRQNTSYGVKLASVIDAYFDQVAFEGSGIVTPVGVSASAGRTLTFRNCWWERVALAGEFVAVLSIGLHGCYLDGTDIGARAFYIDGANVVATFEGEWDVQNLASIFATAANGSKIVVKTPTLAPYTFTAATGGQVVFDYILENKIAYDPPNILAQSFAGAAQIVTVVGAQAGDKATAWFDNGTTDPRLLVYPAIVTGPDTVSVLPFNLDIAAHDLAAGILTVQVTRPPIVS